jgi:hypothetical protein
VRQHLHPRAFALALSVLIVATAGVAVVAAAPAGAAEATICHDAALARQRTEISADLAVPRFDPALGELLEVQVPVQAVHLDTDAVFENTAQSAVVFSETMTYEVTFTSPGGLSSPPAITGSIPRVASQNLTAFDGTLDFLGTSAVAQPSTTRDGSAAPVSATDAPTLAAFTGDGTVAFHVQTAIGESFAGGGGNVQFQINTFVSADVQVCYRYRTPDVGGETITRPPPAAPIVAPPRTAG